MSQHRGNDLPTEGSTPPQGDLEANNGGPQSSTADTTSELDKILNDFERKVIEQGSIANYQQGETVAAIAALIESEVRRARIDEARQITRLMPSTPVFNEFIARKLVKRLAELEAGSGEAAQ